MDKSHHLLQKRPVDLGHLALSEWTELFQHLGMNSDDLKKVHDAVFIQALTDIHEVPGLSFANRSKLSDIVVIRQPQRHDLQRSRDGSYRLTLRLHDGYLAETVIIPEWTDGELRKCSASISSQIGCFFGCSFCATGRMGFHRNLTTAELVAQVRESEAVIYEELDHPLTHLYFMGMGEPMHNFRAVSDALTIMRAENAPGPPPSRITVSTVGLYRQIRMLARQHPQVRLAVSIHSPDQQTRYEIMPVSARLGLPEIRDALVYHTRQTGNPVTIQYLVMEDINDRPEDARELSRYLGDLSAEITLIMYNSVSESGMSRPGLERVRSFQKHLEDSGFSVDIRWCYGEDIEAGCGQLKVVSSEERKSMSMRHETG